MANFSKMKSQKQNLSESAGKDGGLTDTGKARQKRNLKSEHNRKTG